MARAHQLGGWEVLPRRWWVPMEGLSGTALPNGLSPPGGGGQGLVPRRRSVPMERLWATVTHIGEAPPARGTRSPAKVGISAYGGIAGDGSSQRPGPTGWGDGETPLGGGRCL